MPASSSTAALDVDGPPLGGIGELVRTRAASASGRCSYLEHARRDAGLRFVDLQVAVEAWAGWLRGSGVAGGARVGLLLGDPLEFAVAFVSLLAAGRWVAPLDPVAPPDAVAVGVGRLAPDLVVADRPRPAGLGGRWVELDRHSFVPGRGFAPRSSSDDVAPRAAQGPGRPVPVGDGAGGGAGGVVLTSSGTTGDPKVVPLGEAQLVHTAASVAVHHRLSPADRGFNPLPLFHVNAEVVGLLAALVAGAGVVLDDRFHRTGFWSLMERRRITWINAVPAIIARLAPLGPDERVPAGIRFVRSASAPLAPGTLARFEAATGLRVVETYGMTEAASQITANPLDGVRKPGSVGLPVGIDLRVVPDHRAVPDEVRVRHPGAGMVEIRGASVRAEPGDPEPRSGRAGHRRAGSDPDGAPGPDGGWLSTGDVGYLDDDGYLFLVGRHGDVINRGGEKIAPREAEELLLEDPAVRSAAVVGRPDAELGQVPVAYVVLHGVTGPPDAPKAARDVERLAESLRSRFARARRPEAIHVLVSLPATPTGKVRRRALVDGAEPVVFSSEVSR
ncbi:MAG TPA: AMP-binding protein [Acidimicrobiales bacterium]